MQKSRGVGGPSQNQTGLQTSLGGSALGAAKRGSLDDTEVGLGIRWPAPLEALGKLTRASQQDGPSALDSPTAWPVWGSSQAAWMRRSGGAREMHESPAASQHVARRLSMALWSPGPLHRTRGILPPMPQGSAESEMGGARANDASCQTTPRIGDGTLVAFDSQVRSGPGASAAPRPCDGIGSPVINRIECATSVRSTQVSPAGPEASPGGGTWPRACPISPRAGATLRRSGGADGRGRAPGGRALGC